MAAVLTEWEKAKVKIKQYFELTGIEGNVVHTKCLKCEKTPKASVKTNSNLITHLKRHHPELHKQYMTELKQPVDNKQSKLTYYTSEDKYKKDDPRQKKLLDKLIMHIADDMKPLNTVDSPSFKAFVNEADPKFQIPSRKYLSNVLIAKKCAEIDEALKFELTEVAWVCVSLDIWSNRSMAGFLGVTVHYIKDWNLLQRTLCCKRMEGSHTANAIKDAFNLILAEYDIQQKVAVVVTDNATNMIKAFKSSLPGFERDVVNDVEDDITDDFELREDDEDAEIRMFLMVEHGQTHVRCFNHTLQLCVKDGLKHAGSQLTNIIRKASRMVSHVKKSTLASDILKDEKKLKLAVCTRWNSEVEMLKSILSVEPEKMKKACPDVVFTDYERLAVHDLVEILQPFQEATKATEGSLLVTSSMVIPCVRGLKKQLLAMERKFDCALVKELRRSVSNRLTKYETEKPFQIATALDPRFKLKVFESDEQKAIKEMLTERLNTAKSTPLKNDEPPPKRRKTSTLTEGCLFDFLQEDETENEQDELTRYLSQDRTSHLPLEFWKDHCSTYPLLSKLAEESLQIPASSAAVERLFSVAGRIIRPDRCRLNDTNFVRLLKIKTNKALIK